jgi:ribosomal protein S18 acetylase RimI-like enzyme
MARNLETLNKENMRLTRDFRVNPSSCANPEYFSWYLSNIAYSDWQKGLSTTHVLIDDEAGRERIVGYITLRASSFTQDIEGKVMGKPAVEIFELAIADGEERNGAGTLLVKVALSIAANLRRFIGVRYVLLLAASTAVDFYKKFGFETVGSYGEIPKDQMNKECVPMYILLPEEQ